MIRKQRHAISPVFGLVALVGLMLLAAPCSADTEKAKEHFNTALKAAEGGDKAAAISAYEACIAEDANFVDAYINLGALYFGEKDYDKALAQYKAATDKDKQNADAFANLGRVEYQLKKYTESEAAFKKAADLKPDDGEIRKELGKVYYRKKNYAETVSALQKCHELGGGDYLTYYMLGNSLSELGNSDEAIAALKKSTELKGDYYSSHSALGQIYLSQEKYRSAASAFNAAMKADPSKYRAAYNFAVAAENSQPDDYAGNITNWENFIKVAKSNPKAKRDVAVAQDHVKELKAAKENSELQ